jgi:hypothetical protein
MELKDFFDDMKLEWITLWIKTGQQEISTDLRDKQFYRKLLNNVI